MRSVARSARTLRSGDASRLQAVRFVLAGGAVALSYVGLGLLLSGPVGMPIQLAIPIAYVLATGLHFSLQRWIVFVHDAFALSAREQLTRYLPVGIAQYAFTAIATATLPGPLGLSKQVVYVLAVLIASTAAFLFYRLRVFHSHIT